MSDRPPPHRGRVCVLGCRVAPSAVADCCVSWCSKFVFRGTPTDGGVRPAFAASSKRRKSVINAFDGTVEYVTPNEGKYAVPRDLRHRHAKREAKTGDGGDTPTAARPTPRSARASAAAAAAASSGDASPAPTVSSMRPPPPSPVVPSRDHEGGVRPAESRETDYF